MIDLVVPAGTILKIDEASQVAPRYGLFRMGANARPRTLRALPRVRQLPLPLRPLPGRTRRKCPAYRAARAALR
jgi:hypothetical protein